MEGGFCWLILRLNHSFAHFLKTSSPPTGIQTDLHSLITLHLLSFSAQHEGKKKKQKKTVQNVTNKHTQSPRSATSLPHSLFDPNQASPTFGCGVLVWDTYTHPFTHGSVHPRYYRLGCLFCFSFVLLCFSSLLMAFRLLREGNDMGWLFSVSVSLARYGLIPMDGG